MTNTVRAWTIVGIVFAAVAVLIFGSFPAVAFGMNMPAIFGVVFMVLFWAAIIGGGVWLALAMSGSSVGKSLGSKDRAVSLLRERYARGEINRAEYFQMKQDLEADR